MTAYATYTAACKAAAKYFDEFGPVEYTTVENNIWLSDGKQHGYLVAIYSEASDVFCGYL